MLNAFLSSVPNGASSRLWILTFRSQWLTLVFSGGLTTFGSVVVKSLGFEELQVILLSIPRSVASLVWFIVVGLCTSRWQNLRMYFMAFSTLPPFAGVSKVFDLQQSERKTDDISLV